MYQRRPKQRTTAEQNTLRANNDIPTPRFTRAHPVGGWHDPAEHNQVTEQKNQAGEVDTGDIFLLIFASKKSAGFPFSGFVNIAFPYSLPAGSRARRPACECENDNCQERLQIKQERTIPST
jgi:hypothetical protein